jgi:hypothetical protein
MKVLILAYHVESIRDKDLNELVLVMKEKYNCEVYTIPHYKKDSAPIYAIRFINLVPTTSHNMGRPKTKPTRSRKHSKAKRIQASRKLRRSKVD